MGPGEVSHGMALARFALAKKMAVSFAVLRRTDFPFVPPSSARFRRLLALTPVALNNFIVEEHPDMLLLCNSKIFSHDAYFVSHPPNPKPFTASIDSNWLFFKQSPYQSLPWVDRYFVNIPKNVFRFGLKQYGGHYPILRAMLKKIKVVGLIPSYKPLPVKVKIDVRRTYAKPGEKIIFLYASVADMGKPEVFGKLAAAVEMLWRNGRRIRVVHAGQYDMPERGRKRYPWLTHVGAVTTDTFYAILASSDLVFQHQGLGTLEQAIAARVPAIANVKDVRDERSHFHAHAWEVEPFARAGACLFFYFNDPVSRVMKAIEALLYNKEARARMRKKQKALYAVGEKEVFKDIE